MIRIYKTPPSRLLHLTDPYTAWCVDEAMVYFQNRLDAGHKLRPPKAQSNMEMLRRMGIPIKGLEMEK